MTYIIDSAVCAGCGACIAVCPVDAIALDGECARIDDDLCVGCGACMDECPAGAIAESV